MSAQQSAGSESSTSATSPTSHTKQPASSSNPAIQSSPETSSKNVTPGAAALSETTNAPPTSATAAAKASRKRTKTGCLTCRKRRIKCGEERPICANCVKSKRTCEGYNQRVVFKDGMNSLRAVTGAQGASSIPIDRRYHPYPIQPAPPALQTLQPIAPAPPAPQPSQSQSYLREGQLEHAQSHLAGHTYDLHSTPLPLPHTVVGGRQHQPQLSQQGSCNSFVAANSNDYSSPPSTNAEVRPAGPSPFYGGPAAHQRPGYKGTGTVNPCLSGQTSPPVNSHPFNPSIPSFSGPYSPSRHRPDGMDRLYRDNDFRRFPGPPNDEEVSSYYTG